jgi:C4-dicarboxylate transporter, DctM subunit
MLGLVVFNKVMTRRILRDTPQRQEALRRQKSTESGWMSTLRALPALMMPVVILGGIYGGILTPTEAAAVALFMAILIGSFRGAVGR